MYYAHIVVVLENIGSLVKKESRFPILVLAVKVQDIYLRIGIKITKNTKSINN